MRDAREQLHAFCHRAVREIIGGGVQSGHLLPYSQPEHRAGSVVKVHRKVFRAHGRRFRG